jgi:hypothetical protein
MGCKPKVSFRTIRHEHGVDEQIDALGITFKRYDSMMEFVSNVMCEHPEAFPVIAKTKISICKTNEFVGGSFNDVPSLAIYFHYDEHEVRIVSIEPNGIESYGL